MFNLLNRLAWGVSFSLGFFVSVSVFIMSDGIWTAGGTFVSAIILGFIFRAIWFNDNFIKSSLEALYLRTGAEKPKEILRTTINEPVSVVKKPIAQVIKQRSYPQTSAEQIDEISSARARGVRASRREVKVEAPVYVAKEPVYTPKEPGFIQKFFAENALAKIGGILLFLGVLFLLQLVYTIIGPIGKLMIGFALGFLIFGVGMFLEKKGFTTESRVLLGAGILINYLVILSGRYLITENMLADETILSEGITFLLLILNTIFAVVVSLVYNSSAILFFSFVIAYLNPFLIGAKASETPYTLVGYSLIVSLGAILLSNLFKEKLKKHSVDLLSTAFVGGNILFLIAPFSTTSHWLLKLGLMAFVSLICVWSAYKNNQKEGLSGYFVGIYLFLSLLLGFGSYELGALFKNGNIFIGYILFLGLILIANTKVFSAVITNSIFYILVAPLFILITLMYSGEVAFGNVSIVLISFVILYLGIFVYLLNKMTTAMRYSLFTFLGLFIFFTSNHISNVFFERLTPSSLIDIQSYGLIITTFIFVLSAYFFSAKKDLEYLYSLGTVFGIFMLLPIVQREGSLRFASIASVSALVILNMLLPFINKSLLNKNIYNLVSGMIAGALLSTGSLYYFMFGDLAQSKMTLGISFLILAIIYFVLGWIIYLSIDRSSIQQPAGGVAGVSDTHNAVYTFIGLAVSLFSLSIAYIFSKNPEIISTVWLFESSLLIYFYSRTKDLKIYWAGIILMFIGLIKLFILADMVRSKEYPLIISLAVVLVCLVGGLKFMENDKNGSRLVYEFGHMFGILAIVIMLMEIIPSHHHGWSIFGTAIFGLILALVYSNIFSVSIKYFFLGSLVLVFMFQISEIASIFQNLEYKKLEYLKILQHISTLIFTVAVYLFNHNYKKHNAKDKALTIFNSLFVLYLFVITSQYIYYLFNENKFAITIYWSVLSFIFLNQGMQKEVVKYRTFGLYILSLTVVKIIFYDVWLGLSDAVVRVVALMLVGGLMIGISVLYTKKYGGNLKGEFDLENLFKEKE
jgi:hypothetical protein